MLILQTGFFYIGQTKDDIGKTFWLQSLKTKFKILSKEVWYRVTNPMINLLLLICKPVFSNLPNQRRHWEHILIIA